jgi:NAD(P)H-nitrite reductase large subunit
MIVCHCALVTDHDLLEAIECGAKSVDDLAMRCGASQHCGGCRPAVERLLRSPTRAPVRAVAIAR